MRQEQPLLSEMLKNNFIKLAEQPPREFVFGSLVPGQIGRVWQKSSGQAVTMADAREFMAFKDPGFLQVVANMRVEESGESGTVIVRTESRTRAFSPRARKNFTPYWRLIRPFSGLIRRLWLRGIRRRAERELRSNSSFQVKGKIV
jgi:hypothetical protein